MCLFKKKSIFGRSFPITDKLIALIFFLLLFDFASLRENNTDTCQVTINKPDNICQLRLDFEEFTLAQPDQNGLCTTDSFMVRTTVGERLPILCGENDGQHSK